MLFKKYSVFFLIFFIQLCKAMEEGSYNSFPTLQELCFTKLFGNNQQLPDTINPNIGVKSIAFYRPTQNLCGKYFSKESEEQYHEKVIHYTDQNGRSNFEHINKNNIPFDCIKVIQKYNNPSESYYISQLCVSLYTAHKSNGHLINSSNAFLQIICNPYKPQETIILENDQLIFTENDSITTQFPIFCILDLGLEYNFTGGLAINKDDIVAITCHSSGVPQIIFYNKKTQEKMSEKTLTLSVPGLSFLESIVFDPYNNNHLFAFGSNKNNEGKIYLINSKKETIQELETIKDPTQQKWHIELHCDLHIPGKLYIISHKYIPTEQGYQYEDTKITISYPQTLKELTEKQQTNQLHSNPIALNNTKEYIKRHMHHYYSRLIYLLLYTGIKTGVTIGFCMYDLFKWMDKNPIKATLLSGVLLVSPIIINLIWPKYPNPFTGH